MTAASTPALAAISASRRHDVSVLKSATVLQLVLVSSFYM